MAKNFFLVPITFAILLCNFGAAQAKYCSPFKKELCPKESFNFYGKIGVGAGGTFMSDSKYFSTLLFKDQAYFNAMYGVGIEGIYKGVYLALEVGGQHLVTGSQIVSIEGVNFPNDADIAISSFNTGYIKAMVGKRFDNIRAPIKLYGIAQVNLGTFNISNDIIDEANDFIGQASLPIKLHNSGFAGGAMFGPGISVQLGKFVEIGAEITGGFLGMPRSPGVSLTGETANVSINTIPGGSQLIAGVAELLEQLQQNSVALQSLLNTGINPAIAAGLGEEGALLNFTITNISQALNNVFGNQTFTINGVGTTAEAAFIGLFQDLFNPGNPIGPDLLVPLFNQLGNYITSLQGTADLQQLVDVALQTFSTSLEFIQNLQNGSTLGEFVADSYVGSSSQVIGVVSGQIFLKIKF